MRYFKSILVGLLTACIAVVIVILALIRVSAGEGSGAIFVSVSSWQILAGGLIGFTAGFWLTLKSGRAPMRPLGNA